MRGKEKGENEGKSGYEFPADVGNEFETRTRQSTGALAMQPENQHHAGWNTLTGCYPVKDVLPRDGERAFFTDFAEKESGKLNDGICLQIQSLLADALQKTFPVSMVQMKTKGLYSTFLY